MKTPKHSLRKIVSFLNNTDEDGGFWLPNIQRPFVWSEDQICRLFDSILREYPISTLLIWKTDANVRRRRFIDNYNTKIQLSNFYVPDDDKKKCLVLDGQQRLQSLYIGLCGSYERRELYIDILSGEIAAPDDVKYRFEFRDPGKTTFPWVKFKDIVFSPKKYRQVVRDIIDSAGRDLTDEEQEKIDDIIGLVVKTFQSDDGISYQELDSTENKELYSEDDVVEIFIRANSGGTKLGKSDLLFSLLSSAWDDADKNMEDLLNELNRHGFEFNRDFVLKSCLTILDQGARYEVSKFRKPGVREEIENKWDDITKALKDVLDFVRGKTFIRSDKALPSYLVLIPLIYVRYHFKSSWKQAKDVDSYLVRSLLTGAFSGTPDQLIDSCVNSIRKENEFKVSEIFGVIRSSGRSLELTEDRFWDIHYGSKVIHLLFNLWYREFNYTPAYANNMPQVDHIFPQSELRKIKVINPETGRKSLMKYRQDARDQLANCMLLTMDENGPGGKSDTLPEVWFEDKDDSYLDMHLIPKDKSLWPIDRFEDFLEARKELIKQKFDYLISSSGA